MKSIKSIVLALALFSAGTTISFAQTTKDNSVPPHGGIVIAAGEYFIEMVKGAETISFYLLDDKKKTMKNKGVTGKADFDFLNKTKSSSALTTGSNNAIVVSTPKANVFAYCTASMLVKGKTITAKFRNDAVSDEDINHGHQH